MFGLGRFFHIAVDALLLSAVLCGIKRSTGLTPAVNKISSKDLRQLFISYLGAGEYLMDLSIVVMGRSSAFERRR